MYQIRVSQPTYNDAVFADVNKVADAGSIDDAIFPNGHVLPNGKWQEHEH